jgi:metal-dependent amidase/aminoacylase/carboxypeptidase family protein
MIGTIRSLDAKCAATSMPESNAPPKTSPAAAAPPRRARSPRATPITYNDPAITERMARTLRRTAGAANVQVVNAVLGAEDFSIFQQKVPRPLLLARHTAEWQDRRGSGIESLTTVLCRGERIGVGRAGDGTRGG